MLIVYIYIYIDRWYGLKIYLNIDLYVYKLNPNNFPNTEDFYQKEISLPIYYKLSKNEQFRIVKTLKDFLINKWI